MFTLPLGAAAPSEGRCRNTIFAAVALTAVVLFSALNSPAGLPPIIAAAAERGALALVYWASIMLASAPFVLAGSLAAIASARIAKHPVAAPLITLLLPGCDCTLNGFVPALARAGVPAAGFALTWSAACGPAALLATHAALGDRLLLARLAGGGTAALTTALLWAITGKLQTPHRRCAPCDAPTPGSKAPCDTLASGAKAQSGAPAFGANLGVALAGLAVAGFVASCLTAVAPDALHSMSSPPIAALAGALLSPCSTADAVLARVLAPERASQAAFVVAAQCVDVRQLFLLRRHFGLLRMILAAGAGCVGCAVAALVAR